MTVIAEMSGRAEIASRLQECNQPLSDNQSVHCYPSLNFPQMLWTALAYNMNVSDTPPPVVTQLASLVRSRLATLYNTRFLIYHVVQYSQSPQNTTPHATCSLFTIQIQIAPKIKGHSELKVVVAKTNIDTIYLVRHVLD